MTAPTDTPALNGATPGPTEPEQYLEEEQEQLYFDVETWVEGYFAPVFLHRVSDGSRARWCTRWWDHAEAIARLTLLWAAWEAMRWDPAAKTGWWVELDHHLPILLGADGPFRSCRPAYGGRDAKHEVIEAPVNDIAPLGHWDLD